MTNQVRKKRVSAVVVLSILSLLIGTLASVGVASASGGGSDPHRWQVVDTDETSPNIDSPNVFVMEDEDQIGFFGGLQEAPDFSGTTQPSANVFFNDIWIFDADDEEWSLLPVSGTKPSERAFSCAGYDEDSETLYVFGGATVANDFSAFNFFDDTWKFEFDTNTWTELTSTAGTAPSARAGSGCALVDDELFLFSGNQSTFQPTNDLWKFSLDTETWTEVQPSDGSTDPTRPADRSVSNMAPIPDEDQFIVSGGDSFSGGPTNPVTQEDVWVYPVSSDTWEELDTTNTPEIAHLHQAFSMTSGRFFMTQNGDAQGDETSETTCETPLQCVIVLTPTTDTFFYDIEKEKWIEKPNIGQNLPETRRSVMALLDDTMYLWGGYGWDGKNGANSVGKIPNEDTYKLELRDRFLDD